MMKAILAVVMIAVCSIPALAKPRDVYPVSCDDLWAAVKDTLGNPGNYSILSISDEDQKASFIVIGNRTSLQDTVALTAKEGGCAMKTEIREVGSDNPDFRQFYKRIDKSLAKLQAAKAKPAAAAPGQ